MSALPKKLFTATEYLELERKAEFKSEFFGGEIFAMAGASKPHNMIVSNVIQAIGPQTRERDCLVYPGDMRVKVDKLGKYTYPDVAVTCGEERFEDSEVDTLLNPVLIIEVLSGSTEAYDRGAKFAHYQFITSLTEYILIAQDICRVEQFVRQNDGTWTYRAFHTLDDFVKLESIGCGLALKEVYFKIPNIPVLKEWGRDE